MSESPARIPDVLSQSPTVIVEPSASPPAITPDAILEFLSTGSRKAGEVYAQFYASEEGSDRKRKVRHALDTLHKNKKIDWSDVGIISLKR